jgi:prolyl 4-hydroxylase
LVDGSLQEVVAMAQAGRFVEAERHLLPLTESGDPNALFMFADWHYRGVGRPVDLASARRLFAAAADGGIALAAQFVTNMVASGAGGPRDWPAAMQRLEQEAETSEHRRRTLEVLRNMNLSADGGPRDLVAKQMVSETPHIGVFTEFLTTRECGYLASIAQPFFARAVIRDLETGDERPDPVRTSDTATLHWVLEDPVVHAINRRIAAVTQTSTSQGEPMQIFRYAPGQEFRRHVDADLRRANVRVMTFLIYLNDDYEGGETLFTRTGMFVRGGTGDAVMFRNTLPSGELDERAEHAGLPVKRGQKLLASRWICGSDFAP